MDQNEQLWKSEFWCYEFKFTIQWTMLLFFYPGFSLLQAKRNLKKIDWSLNQKSKKCSMVQFLKLKGIYFTSSKILCIVFSLILSQARDTIKEKRWAETTKKKNLLLCSWCTLGAEASNKYKCIIYLNSPLAICPKNVFINLTS